VTISPEKLFYREKRTLPDCAIQ